MPVLEKGECSRPKNKSVFPGEFGRSGTRFTLEWRSRSIKVTSVGQFWICYDVLMTLEDLVESFQPSSLPFNLDNLDMLKRRLERTTGVSFPHGNRLDDNKFVVI